MYWSEKNIGPRSHFCYSNHKGQFVFKFTTSVGTKEVCNGIIVTFHCHELRLSLHQYVSETLITM